MCFFLVKRFKPFVVLLSLFILSVLYTLNSFFADYENNVVMLNLFRPKLTENNDADVDLNKQLLLLRKGFKKSLDQYEASRKNFGKKFHDAVKNASFNNLESNGDILKQHIVCNDDLLFPSNSSPFQSRKFHESTSNQADMGKSWKTVFLIGHSSNPKINHLVDQEASIYKDVVIGSFEDTYRNLYMKMIFSINWPLDQKCHASYILKTDEDCFVNIGNLLNWLSSYHEALNGTRSLYAGRVQIGMEVIRDKRSRYYVSKKDHPADTFHPYVSGGGYVLSGNLLPLLAEVSQRSPVFPNEDALLGSLMHRLGVKPTDNRKFLPIIYCPFYGLDSESDRFREAHMCGLSRQIILHDIRDKRQLKMHFNSALLNYFSTFCSLQINYEEMRDHCY
ncbi:galactosyltransferase [Desmophyllum pertusum]|uniref:Hexosyltransferase n=1 Tax=Desmophyllum pertusum TaxID=174260 RepID=A0A9W9ZZD2_9CNID|nr:galactosyltransferase [Desmophyllum pertusum]